MSSTRKVHGQLGFSDFTLDLNRGALRIDGRDIDLRPQSFKVLMNLRSGSGNYAMRGGSTRPVTVAEVYAAIGDADAAFFWFTK